MQHYHKLKLIILYFGWKKGPRFFHSIWMTFLCGNRSDNGVSVISRDILSNEGKFRSAGSEECLEWKIRCKVAIGVAEGLQYLHCNCQRRIIHRDITASNILLSEDYEAQVLVSCLMRTHTHTHIYMELTETISFSKCSFVSRADIWFWTSKMAPRELGSSCRFSNWRNFWVTTPQFDHLPAFWIQLLSFMLLNLC